MQSSFHEPGNEVLATFFASTVCNNYFTAVPNIARSDHKVDAVRVTTELSPHLRPVHIFT